MTTDQEKILNLTLENFTIKLDTMGATIKEHHELSRKVFETVMDLSTRVKVLEEQYKDVEVVKKLLARRHSLFPQKQTGKGVDWVYIGRGLGLLLGAAAAAAGGASLVQ